MKRTFGIPTELEESISLALSKFKLTLNDSKELAKNVLRLSDFFIQNPEGQTPWNESYAQIAYLSYYLPLNAARISAVIQEADRRDFLNQIENIIDFGAGLATASLCFSAPNSEKENFTLKYTLIERSPEPQKIIENDFAFFQKQNPQWLRTFANSEFKGYQKDPQKTLALFSYSLTELTELPSWTYECEALFILEPSTQQDGRKLLELRDHLLKKNYHVWAPCTHESSCPLLSQSKHDWCHDRIHFEAPKWFQKMEEYLPMKNKTLTMSYLLMRKTKPKAITAARIVGDTLKEKGKDRQMICRGSDREFLAWMHKKGILQEIPRGSLVELPHDLQKVSNELRVQSNLKEIT